MKRLVTRFLDSWRGAGAYAITVPPMDGALQPNEVLEHADLAASLKSPDALVSIEGKIIVSSGRDLTAFSIDDSYKSKIVWSFTADVTCLAISPAGQLAVGIADGSIAFLDHTGDGSFRAAMRSSISNVGGKKLTCPTALAWAPDGSLIVCNGSEQNSALEWKRDLVERGATGSVWRIAADGSHKQLASKLAFPNGILCRGDSVIVSEAWRSRLLEIPAGGTPHTVLTDLPGYPAGLAQASNGGAWLAVFAPRSQLFEFILREPAFHKQMMRDIDPFYWTAPSIEPSHSFLEPLQGGALKQLGIMKPWAPSRSYGLVVYLNSALQPVASAHSRANGTRHGIRNVLELDGNLWVAAKGGNAILTIGVNSFGDQDD